MAPVKSFKMLHPLFSFFEGTGLYFGLSQPNYMPGSKKRHEQVRVYKKKNYRPRNTIMSASKGPRFQFEIQLPSQESKASFSAVLDEAKRLMTPPGQRKLDNYRLLMSLIDLAKQRLPPLTQALESDLPPPRQLSWQESSGEVVVVYAYL